MPSCRRALRWLGSELLCRRSQGHCPEPMRTSQRNLHHQLLRSGVLITRSSHAGMPVQIGTVVWWRSAKLPGGLCVSMERPHRAEGLLWARHAIGRPPRNRGTLLGWAGWDFFPMLGKFWIATRRHCCAIATATALKRPWPTQPISSARRTCGSSPWRQEYRGCAHTHRPTSRGSKQDR